MKKKLFIAILLLSISSYGQYRGTRQNAPLVRTETYVTNSPGSSASNSWLTGFDKDSVAIAWGYPSVQFWKHTSSRNDGSPTSIAWFDNNGYLKRSPIPSWITTESDPKWTSDKVNYYDKSISDARYLQSYAETDPVWSAIAPTYRTKTQNDLLYQPLLGFTPVPNTRTINSKSLASNIIIDKIDIGLSNVDNTSDLNKPISTAMQTALNDKLSSEIDGSITNEIQSLSILGNNLSLSLGGGTISIPTTTYTSGTGISITGNIVTNISPDQIVNLTSGNRISITGTYPNFTIAYIEPTTNIITSKTLNSNYTISTTKQSIVTYSLTCTVTNPLLAGSSTADVYLEYSLNSGSTWLLPSRNGNSSAVGLAVAIAITNGQTVTISGVIPANALVRLRTVTTGTANVTFISGQETY